MQEEPELPSSASSGSLALPDDVISVDADAEEVAERSADEVVDFMECFSVPRIGPVAMQHGLKVGPAVDLQTGFDLTTQLGQQRARQLLHELKPRVLMLSPPCTCFSIWQRVNRQRRCLHPDPAWTTRWQEAVALWAFALELFAIQLAAGRFAALEHPDTASSWALPMTKQFLQSWPNVTTTRFDQCLLGLLSFEGGPVRKRTRLLTNCPALLRRFCNLCPGPLYHFPQRHVHLQGRAGCMSRTRVVSSDIHGTQVHVWARASENKGQGDHGHCH